LPFTAPRPPPPKPLHPAPHAHKPLSKRHWIVTGEVNPAALDHMVRLCVQLDKLRHGAPDGDGRTGPEGQVPAGTTRAREAIEQAIVGKTMNLLVHFENLP
jgi:hypothetical protein